MIDYASRLGTAIWYQFKGLAATNRHTLYGDSNGLRIVCFHDIPVRFFGDFQAMVQWCLDRFEAGTPEDADALVDGRWRPLSRDRILFTFDDGLASHHNAADWLARRGVRAIFFVVPSLLDRSRNEFLAFHRNRGVAAFPFDSSLRSLGTSQALEIAAMGHRLGAHNNAHRDLAGLHTAGELDYEIAAAIDMIAELTNAPCEDFAVAFGQPANLCGEAARYLQNHCRRVYSCVRGLNIPGMTPRLLLRAPIRFEQPWAFTRLCIEGGADHLMTGRHDALRREAGLVPASESKPNRSPAI
jgi:peptidoglycan/xylan/chitin deacetylase (PgdA/CDA1 family)